MAKVPTTLSIDSDVKTKVQALYAKLGLDMSTAVNIFFRQCLYAHGLPFEVRDEIPNQETREAIAEVKRMKEDPSIGKSYTDLDAMFEDLLS